jgi:hypothetical protein
MLHPLDLSAILSISLSLSAGRQPRRPRELADTSVVADTAGARWAAARAAGARLPGKVVDWRRLAEIEERRGGR